MADVLGLLLTIGGYGLILGGLVWVADRARRRGIGAWLAVADEIWHPIAYEPRIEIQRQAERKVPVPSPGDLLWPDPD